MLVGKRMSHPVITVHPDTTMQTALDLMQKENIQRLPVVDKHGKLVGIISEKQLLKASPSDATSLSVWEIKTLVNTIKIEKIMTREVTTVTEDTPIEEAARIMTDSGVGGLPVVEGSKVVGFITETDIFKVFLEVLGARNSGIRLTVLVPILPGTLVNLSKAIYDIGGNILTVGTFLGESSEDGEVVMKIEGVDKRKLLNTVKPYVNKVVDIRDT